MNEQTYQNQTYSENILDNALNERISKLESKIDTIMNRPLSASTAYTNIETKSNCTKAYDSAFQDYLRYGNTNSVHQLNTIEIKSAVKLSSNTEMGYSITTKMYESIQENMFKISPMRWISNVMQISSDTLEIIANVTELKAEWTDMDSHIKSESDAIQLRKQIIPINNLHAHPEATQRLLNDPRLDIEKWLADELFEIFAMKENHAFINGDGKDKPKGILYDPLNGKEENVIYTESGDKQITMRDLTKLYYSLQDKYVTNAKFLMHRSVAEQIMQIKDSNNYNIWQTNVAEKCNYKLFGLEVIVTNDMPEFGSSSNIIIALGDFKKGYQIIDRDNIRILRDPFTRNPFVKFSTTKGVGGAPTDMNAIKFLKLKKK